MKSLLIMRHAKSSWSDENLSDFDRPLNRRGERDAPRMGAFLGEQGLTPTVIICSSAVRTNTTAELVATQCLPQPSIHMSDRLYHGMVPDYLSSIQLVPALCETLLIIGHNPTVERLVEFLSGASESMPTATICCLRVNVPSWDQLGKSGGDSNLVAAWRPKEIFD